jgi:capsid protein
VAVIDKITAFLWELLGDPGKRALQLVKIEKSLRDCLEANADLRGNLAAEKHAKEEAQNDAHNSRHLLHTENATINAQCDRLIRQNAEIKKAFAPKMTKKVERMNKTRAARQLKAMGEENRRLERECELLHKENEKLKHA